MANIKTTDAINNQMSLGELWSALAKLTTHIDQDNKLYDDNQYPIDIRRIQLGSVKALIDAINNHH